jgi:ABC-type amino acid transport substrate-binding protein
VASYLPEKRQNAHVEIRREDRALRGAIDQALTGLLAEGTIQASFDKYGVPYWPPAEES